MPPKRDSNKDKPGLADPDPSEAEHLEEITHLQQELEAALAAARSAEARALQAEKDRADDLQTAKLKISQTEREKDLFVREAKDALYTAEQAKQRALAAEQSLAEANRRATDIGPRAHISSIINPPVRSQPPTFASAAQSFQQGLQSASGQSNLLNVIGQWNQQHTPRSQTKYGFSGTPNQGHASRPPSATSHPQTMSSATTRSTAGTGRQFQDIPLPRQMLYDGKHSWESFVRPFENLATTCGWDDQEKLFRLSSSLRDDAAEYAFCHLPVDIVNNYGLLVKALEARFRERQAVTAYLAQLESRKMQTKEKVTEYIADIRKLVIKSYPTADEQTRETIALRHFLKGLPDKQTVVAVGMATPKTVDDARTAYETYVSLKNDVGHPSRARAAQTTKDQGIDEKAVTTPWVTKQELQKFGDEIKGSVETRLKQIESLIKEGATTDATAPSPRRRVDKKDIECYLCPNKGHYRRECPMSQENQGTTQAEN